MGRTFRSDDKYGYKREYRERTDRKVKKLNKRLRKLNKITAPEPPQVGGTG